MIAKKRTAEGFTLFEIMIAIAIVGGLIAIFYPIVTRYQKRAAEQTARLTLGQLKNAINLYKVDTDQYPSSLRDLVRKPSDPKEAAKWVTQYADEKLVDKSGLKYRRTPGGKHPYELTYTLEDYPDIEPISVWK